MVEFECFKLERALEILQQDLQVDCKTRNWPADSEICESLACIGSAKD